MSPNFYHEENELRKLGISCGRNCKIHSTVIITHPQNLKLGSNIRIDSFTTQVNPKKIRIGNFIHIGSHSLLHAGAEEIHLKDYAGISSGVKIFTQTDDYSGKNFYGPFNKNSKRSGKIKKITLSKYCILGTNAVVIPEAEFGEGCVIGSQSLVSSKLKSWHIYYGVPIRALAKRSKSFLKKKKLKYK